MKKKNEKKILSDLRINKAKPEKKDYQLGDVFGLYLLVRSTGSKIWKMRYTDPITKKRKVDTFGCYPEIGLAQARLSRDKNKELIANGIDPISQKKEIELQAIRDKKGMCVNVIDEWLKKESENTKKITHKSKSRIFNKDVKPFLKNKHIKDVNIDDIVKIIETKLKTAPEIASRIYTHLDNLFRYCVLKKYCDRNILADIRKKDLIKPRVAKHMPKITDINILKRLVNDIYNYTGNHNIKNALILVLHIPLRAENLCNLKWSQINFEEKVLTIKRRDMKLNNINLDDFVMPLTDEVINILREHKNMQISNSNINGYVFLGADNRKSIHNESPNRALIRLGYNCVEDGSKIRLHGFRGVYRSLIDTLDTEGKFTYEVKERVLDHHDRNLVARSYNHAGNYHRQMKSLTQFWSDFICSLKEGVN